MGLRAVTSSDFPQSKSPARRPLLVFGAGGHARVVADAALKTGFWARVFASDRNPARCEGDLLPGVGLFPVGQAARDSGACVHVAIGDNTAREREAHTWGLARLMAVMHPSAMVSPFAVVGAGCFVAAGAVVAPQATLDVGVIINHGAVVDHDVAIGAFTHIAPGAVLGGAACIGARVLVGAGAVVLPGVSVCSGAVIGAGAVVLAPVTDPGTYVGVPARRID